MFLFKESEMHRDHAPYPAQFREQMIELICSGRGPNELSKEFGCHVSSILNWVRQADEMAGAEPAHSAALNANERQEVD